MTPKRILLVIIGAMILSAGVAYAVLMLLRPVSAPTPSYNHPANTAASAPANTPANEPVAPAHNAALTTYTNARLGYSLQIPKQTLAGYGQCQWDGKSYRPQDGAVPVKILEDGNTVYIAQTYYYKLSGETKSGGISYFSACDKTSTTLSQLKDPRDFYLQTWALDIKTVGSDPELTSFIQGRFGKTCSVGKKTPTDQTGVFDIQILGDGKDSGSTGCPINYMYVVKYYPAKAKLAAWSRGQSCYYSSENNVCLDDEMTNSFRFQ